jgi:hypothetical protein
MYHAPYSAIRMSKSQHELFIEQSHKKFIDSITAIIDSSYLTIKTKETEYDQFGEATYTDKDISEAVDTNGIVIAELISVLPDEAKNLGHITDAIETIKNMNYSFADNLFYGQRTIVSTSYYQTNGTLGTFDFHYEYTRWDSEYGGYEEAYEINVSIPNVVYVDHKYYCLTRELVNWLNVAGKAKRQKYLKEITFG